VAVALVSQVLGQSLVAYTLAELPAAFSCGGPAPATDDCCGAGLGDPRRGPGPVAGGGRGARAGGRGLGEVGQPARLILLGSEVRKMREALVSEGLWEVIGPSLPPEPAKP
jgi:hypothetical protein